MTQQSGCRVLLITGKGGVGKTTVAAATGLTAANDGWRTLVMSTDSAHSLADAFDVPLGDEPTELQHNLWAQQIDAHAQLEHLWGDIHQQLLSVFKWGGATGLQVEEVLIFPGMDELFALLAVHDHVTSGSYDLVVVDCAPTAETLRLLTLPEVLSWYVERVLPTERRLMKAARPILGRVSNLPLPDDKVFSSVEEVFSVIEKARDLLSDREITTTRLVVNPEKMVVAEARRTYTYLGFFGYAVVVNRVIPDEVDAAYFSRWKQLQAGHMADIESAFAEVDVLRLRLFDEEMIGLDRLEEVGKELYGSRHPVDGFVGGVPFMVDDDGDDVAITFSVPFVDGSDVDVRHRGAELNIAVGQYRRSLLLPDTFRRRPVSAARLKGGQLRIEFGQRRETREKRNEH